MERPSLITRHAEPTDYLAQWGPNPDQSRQPLATNH